MRKTAIFINANETVARVVESGVAESVRLPPRVELDSVDVDHAKIARVTPADPLEVAAAARTRVNVRYVHSDEEATGVLVAADAGELVLRLDNREVVVVRRKAVRAVNVGNVEHVGASVQVEGTELGGATVSYRTQGLSARVAYALDFTAATGAVRVRRTLVVSNGSGIAYSGVQLVYGERASDRRRQVAQRRPAVRRGDDDEAMMPRAAMALRAMPEAAPAEDEVNRDFAARYATGFEGDVPEGETLLVLDDAIADDGTMTWVAEPRAEPFLRARWPSGFLLSGVVTYGDVRGWIDGWANPHLVSVDLGGAGAVVVRRADHTTSGRADGTHVTRRLEVYNRTDALANALLVEDVPAGATLPGGAFADMWLSTGSMTANEAHLLAEQFNLAVRNEHWTRTTPAKVAPHTDVETGAPVPGRYEISLVVPPRGIAIVFYETLVA